MPFNKMDPSCTIGFYSRTVEEYNRISSELAKVSQRSAENIQHAVGGGRTGSPAVKLLVRRWQHLAIDVSISGASPP